MRPRYAEFFWHCATTVPGWLARVVLANAVAESDGSLKLLHLWEGVDYNESVEGHVLAHARDESRHSRIFLRLAKAAFPRHVHDNEVGHLDSTLPDVRRGDLTKGERIDEGQLIDHLVQMNIGEIRTRLHMHLFAPAIFAFAPAAAKPTVEKVITSRVRDEIRHIGYTARLLERWAASGERERIAELFRRRLHDFHVFTVRQTEAAVANHGQGRFPDLLEI